MNTTLQNKRIPTLFAILMLVGVLGLTINLVSKKSIFTSKANINIKPENLKITNITDNSFTVSFTTKEKSKSLLVIGLETTTLILDDRDKNSGIQNDYPTHYFTVPNLEENTEYRFKILLNDKEFEDDNYIVKTGPQINDLLHQAKNIQGQIIFTDGKFASDVIVTARSNDSQTLSALTDKVGGFEIPITSLRSATLNKYIDIDNNDEFEFESYNESLKSTIKSTFENANNLPIIQLSEIYNFEEINKDISSSGSAKSENENQNEVLPTLTTINKESSLKEANIESNFLSATSASEKNGERNENPITPTQPEKKLRKNENTSNKNLENKAMTGMSLSIILIGVILLIAL